MLAPLGVAETRGGGKVGAEKDKKKTEEANETVRPNIEEQQKEAAQEAKKEAEAEKAKEAEDAKESKKDGSQI